MSKINIINKFKFAAHGLLYLWKHEKSFQWQVLVAVSVQILALVIRLDGVLWALVTFISAAVLCAEAFNTALEKLLDMVEPRLQSQVGVLKNLLAAAVFLVALGSLAVALVIFIHLVF